ncbi:MAG TPA: 16S rRNA (guanine(966)-N(2))-methyltransferase RsmD [Rubricoccaceae bacterium]|nr:16S rRNA (guanine(966)-N(2))-methyltransferase RsmD [Rubricoccaceae bacterium]
MRIIGGRLRGRALRAPKGRETRPTTDRVREALFNLLAARRPLEGARVLDLFAGTGALGLEALSRGAARVVFVEAHAPTLRLARQNAADLGVAAACAFLRADAVAFLRRPPAERFDLAFADPPYDLDALPDLPDLARPHLAPGGLFALEHDARHDFAAHPALVVTRPYGRTVVSIFHQMIGSSDD